MPYLQESGLIDALVAHGYDGAVIESLIARGASSGDLSPLLDLEPKNMSAGLTAVMNKFPGQAVPEFYAAQAAARSSTLSSPSWLPIAAALFAGYLLLGKKGK
jgi:hypothetical protein